MRHQLNRCCIYFITRLQVSRQYLFHLSTLLVGRNFRLAFDHQPPHYIGKRTGDARRHHRNDSFFVGDGIQNASSQTSDADYNMILKYEDAGDDTTHDEENT